MTRVMLEPVSRSNRSPLQVFCNALVARCPSWRYVASLALMLGGVGICDGAAMAREAVPAATSISGSLAEPVPTDSDSLALLDDYYQSILEWGLIAHQRVKPVPGHPAQKYVGMPRNVENDVRATAYTAMVLAFLAEAKPPSPRLSSSEQRKMRADAIGLLRYLTQSHVANEGACANGKQWGKQWQSALWSRAVGFAAWQLWTELDEELRIASWKMIAFEADRFIEKPPKSSLHNDTGAEENAWNASIGALACCMFPEAKQAQQWDTAAKRYMYNTFSVKADAEDSSLGDDGKPIAQWVTTVNAHSDFTVENHRLVHVGYLKNSACMLQESAVNWLLTDRPTPAACNHHVAEVFQVLSSCMNWKGSAIYFAGNDWRLFETQCSDIILYSAMATGGNNRLAAQLERVALDRIRERQQVEKGYFNGRRDLEYGGLCATRLIGCYLLHASNKQVVVPATESEFNEHAQGVRYLSAAKSVLHRTPTKFASFSWAQQRMALTAPSSESVVWPHYFSYLGVINRKGVSETSAKLTAIDLKEQANSFAVTGTLVRCEGKVIHDFYFASPAGDYTIYVERIRAEDGYEIRERHTGLIGVQSPMGSNSLSLVGDFGSKPLRGVGGKPASYALESDWLCVGNAIGYVVKRNTAQKNIMFVRDRSKFQTRRPHLEEWVGLIGNDGNEMPTEGDWSCIVSFVNLDAVRTEKMQSLVSFDVNQDSATVDVDGQQHIIQFAQTGE